jgi:UV DNA damage repair endonuclease
MTKAKTHLAQSTAIKGPISGPSGSENSLGTGGPQLRLGLCCQFFKQPIHFRTTTATSLMRLSAAERRLKLSRLCLSNAESVLAALRFCVEQGIGCFRINSRILPIKTHPIAGYSVSELPEADAIIDTFHRCRQVVGEHYRRVVFHPDQFVVLNSPREDVVEKSIKELEYQAEVAEWVGADVINIHGGGAYNDSFISPSPLEGWSGTKPQRHHDYVNLRDFPDCWRQHRITAEVEAGAKERAVLRLRHELLRLAAASSHRPCRTGISR